MQKKHTIDDYWEIYEKLPKKNQEVFWEDDVGFRVQKIASRFQLPEEERDSLYRVVGQLFLGIIPPSELKKSIKENVTENNLENLSQEIIRFVIYPVQHILRNLYADEEFNKIGVKKDFSVEEKRKWHNEFGDTYREPIE